MIRKNQQAKTLIMLMRTFRTFVYLAHFASLSTVLSSAPATHLMVTHVGPCEDTSGVLMTFGELMITTQTLDCTLSGVFNLTQDLDTGWKVKGTMQKCPDIRNVATCDLLSEFDIITNGCAGNDEEEETYGMLFHYVHPEMECPIKSGVYKLNNYPFFSEDNFLTVYETKISTSVFGYTFNLDGYTLDGRRVFCVEAYLQLLYMRDHDWLRAHNKSGLTDTNKYQQKLERSEEKFIGPPSRILVPVK